jgi:peptidyl-prolyl cis-trans isomerase B (cyclophilin B)
MTITATRKEGLTPVTLEFEVNPETKTWRAVSKDPITLDHAEISKWVAGLAATSAKSFLSDNEKEKSKFGVANPVATLRTTDLAGNESKWTLATYTENKEKKWSLSEASSASTFEVAPTFIDNFKVDLFKFRDKKISTFDSKAITRITISTPDEPTLELVKKTKKWNVMSGEGKTSAAKTEVVETTLRTLTELRADKFHDTATERSLGFTKPQRIVSLEADGAEPVILVFGKSLAPDEVVVKSSQTANPASVAIDLEKTLSIDPTAYIDERAKNAKKSPQTKGDAIKMEATVANLKDLKKLPEPIVQGGYEYTAKMVLQDGKEFEILFDAEAAPYTVSNFLHLARNGFYNNVKFHRVIADFVAQGGDPTGTGSGGPGWKFHDEQNKLTHQRGSLSMANAGPNTNGSQFFVVLQPQPHLNGKHTVFGKITKGLDLIDRIKVGDVMKSVEVFERRSN